MKVRVILFLMLIGLLGPQLHQLVTHHHHIVDSGQEAKPLFHHHDEHQESIELGISESHQEHFHALDFVEPATVVKSALWGSDDVLLGSNGVSTPEIAQRFIAKYVAEITSFANAPPEEYASRGPPVSYLV
jgi:hypothetical protein